MKRYIYAMSTTKRELTHQLVSASLPLTEHLVKLYMFPNSINVDHWKHEVWNFVHQVPRLKGSNKYPSSKLIFSCLSTYLDELDNTADLMQSEYSLLIAARSDYSCAEEMITKYIKSVSDILAKQGRINSSEVYILLDEIGF